MSNRETETAEQRFNIGTISAWIAKSLNGKDVVIIEDDEGGAAALYFDEARLLRDWLNKEIPNE